jgi:tetratricopeptide (TPR) repeat protein
MKAFFIFLAVVVAGMLVVITQHEKIALGIQDGISMTEGFKQLEKNPKKEFVPGQEFDSLKQQNPEAFAAKYKPCLERRFKLLKTFFRVGKYDLCLKIIAETMQRYELTLLDRDPLFAKMIYFYAQIQEDKNNPKEALELYDRYIKEYISYEDIAEVQKRSNILHIALRM